MATDDFNRANGALGANWTSSTLAGGGMTISSNRAISGSGSTRISYYTGASFTADQESEATVAGMVGGSQWAGVVVRWTANSGYRVDTDGAGGDGHTDVGRFNGGSFTLIGSVATSFAASDRLKLRIVGTTLTVWKNSTQVASFTDSSISSGSPGIAANGASSSVDDWVGNNVGAAAAGQAPRSMHQYRMRVTG